MDEAEGVADGTMNFLAGCSLDPRRLARTRRSPSMNASWFFRRNTSSEIFMPATRSRALRSRARDSSFFVEVARCRVSSSSSSRQAYDFGSYSRPVFLGASLRNHLGAFFVKSLARDAVGVIAIAGDQVDGVCLDQAAGGFSAFEPVSKHDQYSRVSMRFSIDRRQWSNSFAVHLRFHIGRRS